MSGFHLVQVVGQGEEEGEEEEEAVTIRSLPVAGSTVYLIVGSTCSEIYTPKLVGLPCTL